MTLLAVDAGRSEVEYKSKHGLGKPFTSAVVEATSLPNPALVPRDLEIEIDGKKWWVGALAQREGGDLKVNNFSKTKVDEILKVQVMASIIYAGLMDESIDLGLIVPISGFTEEERNNIKLLLKGEHKVTYNLVEKPKEIPASKSKIIKINERILIAQEGAAAFWSQPQEEDTQTFDFGAKTVNYAFHEYLDGQSVYVNRRSGTTWVGWESMKLTHGLSHTKDRNLLPEQLDRLASELTKKAIDTANQLNWSNDCLTQVFGGVAEVVFPYVKRSFPRAVLSHDPRNGNVEGLFRILEEAHAYA